MEADPELIADQLCLHEFAMMKRIQVPEFIKQNWNKERKMLDAPNIISCIEWFNKLSGWISTEILKHETPQERSFVIGKFIKLAARVRENNNFNCLMEVMSSLHSAHVSRLRDSWGLIPKELIEKFENMSSLMNPKGNWNNYRECVRGVKGTKVLYLGLLLQDLTFIDDANPDHFEGTDLFNLEKMNLFSKRMLEFQEGLLAPYPFELNETLSSMFSKVEVYNENDFIRISKLLETKKEDISNVVRFDSKTFSRMSLALMENKKNMCLADVHKLTSRDWKLLLAVSQNVSITPGTVILDGGISNTHMYRIKSGKVKIFRINEEDGKKNLLPMFVLKQRDIFGELAVLGKYGLAGTSAIAEDAVEVAEIELSYVEQLFTSDPGLAARFYCKIAVSLAERLVNATPNPNAPRGTSSKILTQSTSGVDVIEVRIFFEISNET